MPAQLAKGVQLVNIASSVTLSRRDAAPPARWARTRRARDPRPVRCAGQGVQLASIRADAAPLQGPHSARTALLPRGVTARRDPPTGAQRPEPRAHLGTSAWVELRTSKFAQSLREDTVLLQPCQRRVRCARLASGAQEVQTTRQSVREARILPRTAHHRSPRAPTALWAHSHPKAPRTAPSAPLEQSRPHWVRPPATSARRASLPCPRVLLSVQVAPRARRASPAASRRRTAIWTVTALLLLL